MILNISVVLFDLGGVLVELQGPEVLVRLSGHSKSREEVRALWRRCSAVQEYETGCISLEAFAERVVLDLELPVTVDAFLQDYPSWMSRLHVQSMDVLRLASRHFRIAALSNISAVHWGRLETSLLSAPAFERSVLSFETGFMKPDPEAYRAAIDQLDVPPDQILFLDDNETNVHQARTMGMHSELTSNAHQAEICLSAFIAEMKGRKDGQKR